MIKNILALFVVSSLFLLNISVASAARLPTVGGDSNEWGTILNDYLQASHDANGSIKNDLVTSSMIINGTVGTQDIADNAVTNAKINDVAYSKLTGAPTALSSFINDAGYLTSETDPTVNLSKLRSLASSDFHNLGGTDADTTYSAGTGLALAGTVFSLADNGVTQGKLASNSVGAGEIQSGAVGTSEIAENAVTDDKVVNTITASNYLPLAGGSIAGTLDVNGEIRAINNGATSFRLRGASDLNGDGVADSTSQSYAGVFYNAAYDDTGGTGAKTTRAVYGSNEDMDLELQGSNHIRITAVDNNVGTGRIRLAAEDEVQIHTGVTAETDAASYIKFDTRGGVAGGNPTIETNAAGGQLLIQPNADSSGRIRFFRDTTGNPMFNIWGYDSGDAVQKYITIFVDNNAAYTETGTTARARAIITSGGNEPGTRNALELQSPDQVRITAVDNVLNKGNVRIAADTYTAIHSRTDAETDAAKFIKFDTLGGASGGWPTIETNAANGELHIQPNADSDGRVRFFKDSAGMPKIFIYGKDSAGSQKRIWLGVYQDNAFTESGGTTRAILGAASDTYPNSNGIGFEIQSPDQVRITSVDNAAQRGSVRIAADTSITFHPRTVAETDAAKNIIIDTVGGTRGDGTDPVIKTNAGSLVLDPADRVNIKDVMRLQPIASPPSSPSLGDMYVDDSGALCFYDSTEWDDVSRDGDGECA